MIAMRDYVREIRIDGLAVQYFLNNRIMNRGDARTTDELANLMEQFVDCESLKYLDVTMRDMSTNLATAISDILASETPITNLELSNRDNEDIDMTAFVHGIERNRSLTGISLDSNCFGTERFILAIAQNPHLRLSYLAVHVQNAQVLRALPILFSYGLNVEHVNLNFQGSAIDEPVDVMPLLHRLAASHITGLSLVRNPGQQVMADFANNFELIQSLTMVELRGVPQDLATTVVAKLKLLPRLEDAHVTVVGVPGSNDNVCLAVADLIHANLESLKKLDIRWDGLPSTVTLPAMTTLATAIGDNTHLTRLVLGNIVPAGSIAILATNFARNEILTNVTLRDFEIDEVGAHTLMHRNYHMLNFSAEFANDVVEDRIRKWLRGNRAYQRDRPTFRVAAEHFYLPPEIWSIVLAQHRLLAENDSDED